MGGKKICRQRRLINKRAETIFTPSQDSMNGRYDILTRKILGIRFLKINSLSPFHGLGCKWKVI
jgi:hypothetical protein